MARSRSRGGRSSGGGNKASRSTSSSRKSTSRRSAAPAAVEAEVVEESSGLGIDDGVAIITTLVLLAAILFVDYELGKEYGAGLFFIK